MRKEIEMLIKFAAASAILLCAIGAHAQVAATAESILRQQDREFIARDLAPIDTREDLIYYLNNSDPKNPLNKLSAAARQRLLDDLIVNDEGQISSYRIDDIRTELSPSEAYRVFSLFGHAESAAKLNNGRIDNETDRKIIGLAGYVKSQQIVPEAYCNGGYCTYNQILQCDAARCRPPH